MSDKNGMDILNQEIEIPHVVDRKAQEAFSRILGEAGHVPQENTGFGRKAGRRKMSRRRAAAAILAAVLALGTMTVAIAASNSRLSAGIKGWLGLTDEQERELIENNDPILDLVEERNTENQAGYSQAGQTAGYQNGEDLSLERQEMEAVSAAAELISATDQGITITVEQTMADNFVIMMAFRIEGAACDPETEQMLYFHPQLMLDGRDAHDSYDGRTTVREDGTIEYDVVFRPRIGEEEDAFLPGEFIGKEIQISVDKVYIYDSGKNSENSEIVEGAWDMSWTLGGTDVIRIEKPDMTLGDTGAVVKEIQISPLSLTVFYDFPYQVETVITTDQDGNTGVGHEAADPPLPFGIVMADGTEYTRHILGGGTIHVAADSQGQTYIMHALDTLIDPAQVAGVLIHDNTGVTGESDMGTVFRVMFEK